MKRLSVMGVLAVVGAPACSMDFDGFLRRDQPVDASTTMDVGTLPEDSGTPPIDTGNPIVDTGNPIVDTGNPVTDTGNVAVDRPIAPTDTGNPQPTGCAAPYMIALAHNLDSGAGRLLRWSFSGSGSRCADLPITVSHPMALGVAFENIATVEGPSLVVVNDQAVSIVDATTGQVVRDVASEGRPRSVFDIVANGQGTFAVAYSWTGDTGNPGSVGMVRVFNHRNNTLTQAQMWQRGSQFGQSVTWMAAFPGNQGQYLTLTSPMSNNSYSAFVTSPFGSPLHERTTPAVIVDRIGAVSMSAYRTADRRGHYAVALSTQGGPAPSVFVGMGGVAASRLDGETYVRTAACSEACPRITRAMKFPTDNGTAAAICERSLTDYTVLTFGSTGRGCVMLDTAQLSGRWRIEDLAMMPR